MKCLIQSLLQVANQPDACILQNAAMQTAKQSQRNTNAARKVLVILNEQDLDQFLVASQPKPFCLFQKGQPLGGQVFPMSLNQLNRFQQLRQLRRRGRITKSNQQPPYPSCSQLHAFFSVFFILSLSIFNSLILRP